ncbi:MAG: CoA-binding protein [Candidatus Hodarchaeaceae archaeon]|nr:CoA-binding protein [Candidatus Hodarchaeaceae archaeon]
MALSSFFEPSSVAVVGASREPGKLGYEILRNIIEAGFKGKLYPINPKADEILGLKCYPSVKDVQDDIELAVIIVPARFVPSVMTDCAAKGVPAAAIISGGFRESGAPGEELERQTLEIAKRAGIRIIGPNCQGVNSTFVGLCASWPLVKVQGPISIVSQSGTIGAALGCWAADEGIGICKLVALGNKCDVDETELLEYLAEDPRTKVVALYMEGVRDGRRFMETSRAAARRKPVVVLKGGRTAKGAEAVLSHTRSLAGSDVIFDVAFKQAGVIRVLDVEELYDVCKGFAHLPLPEGDDVVIVTSSGGSGILATDACEELGLNVVELPANVRHSLEDKLPPECILRNPLDLTGSATSQMYDEVLTALSAAAGVHSVIAIVGDPMPGIADVIAKHFGGGRTLIPVMLGGGRAEIEERAKLQKMRVPVYSSPVRAARTLAALVKYARSRKSQTRGQNL